MKIRDINPTKLAWNLKVRIVRLYEFPSKWNPREIYSMELVLQDERGDRIHCSIPKSNMASQPINSISDELHGGSLPITTIEEVLDKTNETSCWILATVVSIEIGGSDWYYALCKSCPRKVKENKGCYLRKHCGKVGINTPLRYHLHVIAADGTGCIGLIIWNQEAKLVVGKSASEVKKISVIQVRRAFLSAVLRLLARVLWLIQMQFISYKKIEAMVGVHKNHLL
ncbi:hypothetical protein S83_066161, partial [Arachis hypogaea]